MNHPNGERPLSRPDEDPFFHEQLKQPFAPPQEPYGIPPFGQHPPYAGMYADFPRKRKFAAGILAFFIPGTGHFYLGLMQKGLMIMLGLALDIGAVIYTTENNMVTGNSYIPFVVLLSCLIPVLYFYNLFDALQSTDHVNNYRRAVQLGQIPPPAPGSDALGRQIKSGTVGIGLMVIGLFLFFISAKPFWMEEVFDLLGSYVGAVLLIGAGILLFINESRKK